MLQIYDLTNKYELIWDELQWFLNQNKITTESLKAKCFMFNTFKKERNEIYDYMYMFNEDIVHINLLYNGYIYVQLEGGEIKYFRKGGEVMVLKEGSISKQELLKLEEFGFNIPREYFMIEKVIKTQYYASVQTKLSGTDVYSDHTMNLIECVFEDGRISALNLSVEWNISTYLFGDEQSISTTFHESCNKKLQEESNKEKYFLYFNETYMAKRPKDGNIKNFDTNTMKILLFDILSKYSIFGMADQKIKEISMEEEIFESDDCFEDLSSNHSYSCDSDSSIGGPPIELSRQ